METVYQYKTRGGLERRIASIKDSISTFRKLRGSRRGTFWKDLESVDESILRMELQIKSLETMNEIRWNNNILVKELKSSEIF